MNVQQLIDVLRLMPPDATVLHLWDGAARTEIKHVYLSKRGDVVTSDDDMVYYDSEDGPMARVPQPDSAPKRVIVKLDPSKYQVDHNPIRFNGPKVRIKE